MKGKKKVFNLKYFLSPSYLYERIASIDSFADLSGRLRDLLDLFCKIVTGRYGEKYWKAARAKRRADYDLNADSITDLQYHFREAELSLNENDIVRGVAVCERIQKIKPDVKFNNLFPVMFDLLRVETNKKISSKQKNVTKECLLSPVFNQHARLRNNVVSIFESESEILCSATPLKLHIVPTNICNLNCIMCSRVSTNPETIPYTVLKKKIWPLLENIVHIHWEGGEVLSVSYFRQLLDEIKKEFPHVMHSLTTNGLLLNRELIDYFSKNNIILAFSIDSITKSVYEKIRAGGDFDILLANLEYVKQAYARDNGSNYILEINFVVMNMNYKELEAYPDFCKKYGINNLTLLTLSPPSDNKALDFVNNGLDMPSIIEEMERKCRKFAIKCRYNFVVPQRVKLPVENKASKAVNPGGKLDSLQTKEADDRFCKKPWDTMFLYYNGEVRPSCECIAKAGNFYEDDLLTIWNNSVMQKYRSSIICKSPEKICSKECFTGVSSKAALCRLGYI